MSKVSIARISHSSRRHGDPETRSPAPLLMNNTGQDRAKRQAAPEAMAATGKIMSHVVV